MNKIEIYLSTLMSSCIGFFFNFIMFTLYYHFIAKDAEPYSFTALYFILLFVNLLILSLAFSLILSTVYIVAKDITQIWVVITGLGFWLSPILFKLETFRNALPGLDYINPISGIIINSRNVLIYNTQPDWNLFVFNFCYASALLVVGLILLNRLGSKAAEKL